MKKASWLVCLLMTLGFIGCAGDRYNRDTEDYMSDKAIEARVKTALAADPVVEAVDVNVEVFRRKVQLSGFVETSAQKKRAVQVAKEVEGVESVVDSILLRQPPK